VFPWLQIEEDEEMNFPEELPILPLRNIIAFPFTIMPLTVGIPRSMQLVDDAMEGDHIIGLVGMKNPEVEVPGPDEVFTVGTIARVHKVMRAPDDTLQVIIQGIERFRIDHWTATEPYLKAKISVIPDEIPEPTTELEALREFVLEQTGKLLALMPNAPEGLDNFLAQVDNPRTVFYMITSNVRLDMNEAQALLEENDFVTKLRRLGVILTKRIEVLEIGQKIQEEARQDLEQAQKEFYLRQQMKAIRKELGEESEPEDDIGDYHKKIAEAGMPEEAEKEALHELKRLKQMPPQAAEYSVIKTYLDWLLELPWNNLSEDNLDIDHAREVLDKDHYDLVKVKERILEYLAVRKLVSERKLEPPEGEEASVAEAQGAILCFVGPPGVGKTSLGRSIARALGRKFTHMSLGGMRDEAEIRGHRRTYIGAMPGRIIQALKRVGTRNPVFMLDEVDKIGSDWRGDPSSALLEVLDPQQNHAFRDHYLDVDFDLSQVIFVTTANVLETIPAPLRDRMEILTLDGYTEEEKVAIAENYLVPRQRRANGLQEEEIVFKPEGLRTIIREYTREAGVRNLEREIGSVCRKVAVQVAAGQLKDTALIDEEAVHKMLGKPKFFYDTAERVEIAGVATGLAWTPFGGDILFIEATSMRGKGDLVLTGQLGDVMKESGRIALSYIRSRAANLGIDEAFFGQNDIHVHIPAGAIPKDGPSAGVTMVTAIVSLLTDRPVRAELGMTGEITLRGKLLPVGGIKQKVLAAHRAGLKHIILPKRNEKDLDELPTEIRQEMTFELVETTDEALELALQKPAA